MKTSKDLSHLKKLGYKESFEVDRIELNSDLNCLARVIAEHRGVYEIIGLEGESRAVVDGKRMQNAMTRDDYPAVGDWVLLKRSSDNEKIIEHILPRLTTLRKKYTDKNEAQLMVANVDVVFVVESMDRDYNINRFERYLVLAREGGVMPIIVLNKSDLLSEAELALRMNELHDRFPDTDILHSSSYSNDGLDKMAEYIVPGNTYCFLGSSGVGKSSIISKLIDQSIETKTIGSKTGRGRHTTTSRHMYFTKNGGVIIDNPGSREVGIVKFDDGAKDVFTDIAEISANCRFSNCSHTSEQGCAVLAALQSGEIEAARYENYLKLQKETEHYQMSVYEKRKKDKKFGKMIKKVKIDSQKYE